MDKSYEILSTNSNYAVIGMTDDQKKFSYRIYTLLKNKGKITRGIHHRLTEVEGERIYNSIEAIEDPIDVAVFVVNPTIGINYLEPIKAKGISTIWLQPGTVSDELVTKANDLGLNVVEDCVLATYARNESK